jgi:hypothetical protein
MSARQEQKVCGASDLAQDALLPRILGSHDNDALDETLQELRDIKVLSKVFP